MLNRFSFLSLISLFCMCRTLQKTENMQRSVQIVWVHCCLLWSQVFLLHYMKWKLMHKWMRNENTTWKYCCYIPIFLLCPLFVSLLCTSFHFFHSIPCDCLVSNHFFSILCVFFLANYSDWPEIQIKDSTKYKYEYEQQITDVIFMAVKQ